MGCANFILLTVKFNIDPYLHTQINMNKTDMCLFVCLSACSQKILKKRVLKSGENNISWDYLFIKIVCFNSKPLVI